MGPRNMMLCTYRKVACIRLSLLVPHPSIFSILEYRNRKSYIKDAGFMATDNENEPSEDLT